MLPVRARTPQTSAALSSEVTSLILNPPIGVSDPWLAAYEIVLPVIAPQDTPGWFFAVLYFASAAWVALWLLALAVLVIRARRSRGSCALFTVQTGIIVPRTTTLFLICLVVFLGVAQGYLWKTILVLRNWHSYPGIVELQAATWSCLSFTAYAQSWGLLAAACFARRPTRSLHSSGGGGGGSDRPRRPSTSSRAGSPTNNIGKPAVPPLSFNLAAFFFPAAFLAAVVTTGVFSSRHCGAAFDHFREAEALLGNASVNAQAIASSGQTQAVLNQVLVPMQAMEAQGEVCDDWTRWYYAMFGIVPILLLVAEVVGFFALHRQLSLQLSLLSRASVSSRTWAAHETSTIGHGGRGASPPLAAPVPILPLSLPANFSFATRPGTGGSSGPNTPGRKTSFTFSQAQHGHGPPPPSLRLQHASSTSVSSPGHGADWGEPSPERKLSKTAFDGYSVASLSAHGHGHGGGGAAAIRRDPPAWAEAKIAEVERARRNLVLQTLAWCFGALQYGAMAWLCFAGVAPSGLVLIWSFAAMPVIALPILLTLLHNGLSSSPDVDQGFIGLVPLPDHLTASPTSRDADPDDDWALPPLTALPPPALAEKPPRPSPPPRTSPPPPPVSFRVPGGHDGRRRPSATSVGSGSRRLPDWTFEGTPPPPSTDSHHLSAGG